MFIFRHLLKPLRAHLKQKEISLILGPRQSGKTTLALKLKEELAQKGEKTAYFNLDRLEDLEFFQTQKTLLEKIKFELGESRVVVFIDEIQRLKNAGIFLKGLYDYLSPYKFVVTGSGSLELKENIVEPLTGRKKVFYLYPLSFGEFFEFKTGRSVVGFGDFFKANPRPAKRVLEEYLVFGGYPRVVLAKTAAEKKEALEEIYLGYLEKDVRSLLGVEKDLLYFQLLKYLAAEVGSLFKKAEVSRNLGLDVKTLSRYLFLLEKTFVIVLIRPFFKNPTKELTKTPKVYFLDLGLRNFILGRLQPFSDRDDKGKIFENFVLRQILEENAASKIWFWRTEAGAEVDFVLPQDDSFLPVEVKATEMGETVGRGLLSFLEKYHLPTAVIVHRGEEKTIKKNGKTIKFQNLLK